MKKLICYIGIICCVLIESFCVYRIFEEYNRPQTISQLYEFTNVNSTNIY